MGLISLLISDPATFLILSVLLLYSVIFHELAHGWAAYKMGDFTAKWMGRLTLNPIKHLDIVGTLMLFFVGFGWAKPVPVNLNNIPNHRLGLILVSSAGAVTNIICAFVALLLLQLASPAPSGMIEKILYIFARINLLLAAFNLIPIPPLDGSKILMGFTPESFNRVLYQLEPFGIFIVLGLLLLGALNPVINLFQYAILVVISLFLPG